MEQKVLSLHTKQKDKKLNKHNSQLTVLHKKNSSYFSSWRRVLPPRTTPRSRRYSSRYITKIEVCTTPRALFLSFYFSLSLDRGGPQKSSSTHLVDEITSLTDKLFFSLSVY